MSDDHILPEGCSARPATDADLDAVVRLVDDADRALGLELDPIREFLSWVWHIPSTDLGRDTRLIVRRSEVAGFAQATWNPEEGGPLRSLVRVHPSHRGRGIGSWGLGWSEAVAAMRGSSGVRAQAEEEDDAGRALLMSRGYVPVRTSWTMIRHLEADEAPGEPPAEVTIRAFRPGSDERSLHDVYEASFADQWAHRPESYETFAAEMYEAEDWDPSLAHLAEADGAIVGHSVALSFAGDGYVALLGVRSAWRGRGIGKALLRRAFSELAKRGHREVRLNVDAQNPTGAVALYESVGMTAYRAQGLFELGTPDAERLGASTRSALR